VDLRDTSHSSRAGLFQRREPQFDGIGFSTTIHLAGKAASSNGSEAVEFVSPFSALHRYEKYDCSGQQLIDASAVLINGERVSLDLQIAEAVRFVSLPMVLHRTPSTLRIGFR
jgi:hypothetical protein